MSVWIFFPLCNQVVINVFFFTQFHTEENVFSPTFHTGKKNSLWNKKKFCFVLRSTRIRNIFFIGQFFFLCGLEWKHQTFFYEETLFLLFFYFIIYLFFLTLCHKWKKQFFMNVFFPPCSTQERCFLFTWLHTQRN